MFASPILLRLSRTGTATRFRCIPIRVPVRLSLSKIGEANILCARTRPKLIGGERAKYTEED